MLNLHIYVSSFDTTAVTLSLTAWYLVKHQDVQDKLRAEINNVCSSDSPTYEQLNEMKYAAAVIKEVLRHHPIASQ